MVRFCLAYHPRLLQLLPTHCAEWWAEHWYEPFFMQPTCTGASPVGQRCESLIVALSTEAWLGSPAWNGVPAINVRGFGGNVSPRFLGAECAEESKRLLEEDLANYWGGARQSALGGTVLGLADPLFLRMVCVISFNRLLFAAQLFVARRRRRSTDCGPDPAI